MKNPPLRYRLINVRRVRFVGSPSNADGTTGLKDVDGYPHAGGIDVRWGEEIVTVPWHDIASAYRKVPPPEVEK